MASGGGNEKAIVGRFQEMRAELTQIWNKITELDMERNEHTLVLNAILPLDATRKCFRLIGGVLVERTVGEVLPAVQRNKDGIEKVRAWALLDCNRTSYVLCSSRVLTPVPFGRGGSAPAAF
jgi:chaperonin cofactor prefoldin